MEGIFHTMGARGLINWNVINQLQVPIHIRDDCSDTELHCNDINNDTDPGLGVLLTSAVLPDQGFATTPWNNRWFGYNSTTLFGVNTDAPGAPFDWFYNTVNAAFNPNPDPNAAQGQATSATGITCAVEAAPDDPDRDLRYSDIVEDSLSFADYVNEFTYKTKQYLFEKIYADTNLLIQNTSKDSIFNDFYLSYKVTNLGLFVRVDSLIEAGNLDAAYTLNNSIADTNQIETNQKAINGILVTKVLRDSVLNESDSTTLQEIAIQDPILGGKAVFMARAILFEEIHDVLPALRTSAQPPILPIPKAKKSSFALVPNPATDRCEIRFLNMEHDFILEIRNSVGQLIYYKKIAAKTSSFEIALTQINSGFYLVSINDGVAIFDQKKLVIAK
ncbi:MAG: T9SS type A sorting domain-containing protein [Bacteroidetes bacterium]|nr:T9SS type A sorting domain-containing protein [Bacteroidota bacterium]